MPSMCFAQCIIMCAYFKSQMVLRDRRLQLVRRRHVVQLVAMRQRTHRKRHGHNPRVDHHGLSLPQVLSLS